ncbi:MAG: hypothetical protein FWH18_03240 [Marinilabiliaceae bacterium]|nr:hypothetical protein [Marinilabiliaceae bacterium]
MQKIKVFLTVMVVISLITGCKQRNSQQQNSVADENDTEIVSEDSKTDVDTDVKTIMGYIKFESNTPNGNLQLLFDEVLWIKGNDTETMKKYGYDHEDIFEDFILHNEVEDWKSITTNNETTYQIIVYDYNTDMVVQFVDVSQERFKQHLVEKDYAILVNLSTTKSGAVQSINEHYMP